MTLDQAKRDLDKILASMFYSRMKDISADKNNAQDMYKQAIEETSSLLFHMKDQLDILFGQDTEALAQFLARAGVTPASQVPTSDAGSFT